MKFVFYKPVADMSDITMYFDDDLKHSGWSLRYNKDNNGPKIEP